MPEETEQPQASVVRNENYETLYANNVQFQPFEWDLRLSFGELDVRDGRIIVDQHTAISVPWLQAKLMIYFLELQVGIHEMVHEKIKISGGVFPPEPTAPTGGLEHDPMAIQVFEFIKAKRAELLASST